MSRTYPEYPGTQFPDRLDSFTPMMDVSIKYKDIAAKYYSYINAGQYDAAAQFLRGYPELDQMLMNADKINTIYDAIKALEKHYLEDVEDYVFKFWNMRGTYSPTAYYTKGDVVFYQIGDSIMSYMAIQLDIPPGTDPTNLTYWHPATLIGPKGENGINGVDGVDGKDGKDGKDGQNGIGLVYQGEWDSSLQYTKDDLVTYGNALWAALAPSLDVSPAENNTRWKKVLSMELITGTQEPGNSTDKWISQKGVTDYFVQKSQILNYSGDSETDTMSQKAISDLITERFSIIEICIPRVPSQSGTIVYDGQPHFPVLRDTDEERIIISGIEPQTDAGVYTFTATPIAPWVWADTTSEPRTLTWEIQQAESNLSAMPTGLQLEYNLDDSVELNVDPGAEVVIEPNNDLVDYELNGNTVTFTAKETPGMATFRIYQKGAQNYKDSSILFTVEVKENFGEAIDTPTLLLGKFEYDGTEHVPVIDNIDLMRMNVAGVIAATDAGQYVIEYTPKDGYVWSDRRRSPIRIPWEITSATGLLSVEPTELVLCPAGIKNIGRLSISPASLTLI